MYSYRIWHLDSSQSATYYRNLFLAKTMSSATSSLLSYYFTNFDSFSMSSTSKAGVGHYLSFSNFGFATASINENGPLTTLASYVSPS